MFKLFTKSLIPIAMVLAGLFGYSIGQGHPQYWYLIFVILLFLLDIGITFILDKVTDFNFYKDSAIKLWSMRGLLKRN